LGDRHLVGCVVKAPSSKVESGYIDIKKIPKIVLGITNTKYDQAEFINLSEFCDQLTRNGLDTQNTTKIRAEICKKLAVNITTNTLAALTSKNTAALTDNPLSKTLIVDMLEEANQVFKAFNIDVQDLPTQQELFTYIEDPGSQNHLPSLAQDFYKHQAGELTVIEAPVEMARISGLRVPILESVLALLKAGQDYALRKDCDTNLLQFDSNNAKFTLNPNVFQTSTLRKFRLTDLLVHVDRLNQNSMVRRACV
jgi:2-dehydropantoate 2-reductase